MMQEIFGLFRAFFYNRSPAPHFRRIRPPHSADYSSEACLKEPGPLDNDGHGWPSVAGAKDGTGATRLQILVIRSFDVQR
jgi:hypothetical protein